MNREIKDEDLAVSIALYRSKYGYFSASEVSDWIEENEDYIRVTEPIHVEFTALPDDAILRARVASIDNTIEKVRAEYTVRINDLTDQRNRLLAITHQPDPAHSELNREENNYF